MGFHSIVLVKQVPDTAHITGDVMKPDGTINRAKLPAVFNPEDRVALELALRVKDEHGGQVSALTMGPPKATDVLRECLYMGADDAILISDRKFAGADTLATSYVLAEAIRKVGAYDLIFAGRQAIDGDTAQVGPQVAEKLGLPQVTYTESILEIHKKRLRVKRRTGGGYEILECALPALLTVIKGAAEPRPFRAKRAMTYKSARSLPELEAMTEANPLVYIDQLKDEYLASGDFIRTFTRDELDVDIALCGLSGSPTKVHSVESVVLGESQHLQIKPTKDGMRTLVGKLKEDRIFG